jgi:hypothetical protein
MTRAKALRWWPAGRPVDLREHGNGLGAAHARRLVEAVAIGAGRGEYLTIAGSPALTGMRARNDALFGAARTVRQPVRCRRAASCPAALRLRGRPGRRGPGESMRFRGLRCLAAYFWSARRWNVFIPAV